MMQDEMKSVLLRPSSSARYPLIRRPVMLAMKAMLTEKMQT